MDRKTDASVEKDTQIFFLEQVFVVRMQNLMQSLLKFLEFYASLETYPYNKVKKQAFLYTST